MSESKEKKPPLLYRAIHRSDFVFNSVSQAYDFRPHYWIMNLCFFLIILALFIYFGISTSFFSDSLNVNETRLSLIFKGIFDPDFSYMFGYGSFTWKTSTVYQSIQTFAIAFVGTAIASILSIPFGFLASRKIVGHWAIVTEIVLIAIRTMPEIILGYVMIQGFGFSSTAGVMVLSISSIGMIGKLYSEALDAIAQQPIEAISASGGNLLARIRLGIVPQITPNFLSVILYRLDLNLRTATLLGLVAGEDSGLGYWINNYSTQGRCPQFGAALWCTVVMILLTDWFSSRIRRKLI